MALTPSPGDLVQVLQWGVGAYKALDEKTGSTDEYRKLKNELRDLNNLIEIFRKEELPFIPEAYKIIVVEWMSDSTALAKDIERFLKGYSLLDLGVESLGWWKKRKKTYKKFHWKFTKSKDVPKLESKLSQHRSSLICFTQISISAKFNTLLRNPSFDSSNGVTIVDLFGKSLVFPLSFCASWGVLQEHLIIHYKHHAQAGTDYVRRGDYGFLITKNGKYVTSPTVWETTVKVGMEFQMAVLLQMSGTSKTLRSADQTCPRCRRPCNSGKKTEKKKYLTCNHCDARFEVIERKRVVTSGRAEDPLAPTSRGDDRDQSLFKAFLLVLLETRMPPKVPQESTLLGTQNRVKKKGWFAQVVEAVHASNGIRS